MPTKLLLVIKETKIHRPAPLLPTHTPDTNYRKHFATAVRRKELTLGLPYHPTDAVPLNLLQYSYHYRAASRLVSLSTKYNRWVKVFKNGPKKICGRQSLKTLKRYGLLRQAISLQIF